MHKKLKRVDKKLGQVEIFLDDLVEIARILEDPVANPTRLVDLETDEEELTGAEVPQLKGRKTKSFKMKLLWLRIEFDGHTSTANFFDSVEGWGAVGKIDAYLSKHCRPPVHRRHWGLIVVTSALSVLGLTALDLLTPRYGRLETHWTVWWCLVVALVAAVSGLISIRSRTAVIHLVPRNEHQTWWGLNKDSLLNHIVGSTATLVITAVGSSVCGHARSNPADKAGIDMVLGSAMARDTTKPDGGPPTP